MGRLLLVLAGSMALCAIIGTLEGGLDGFLHMAAAAGICAVFAGIALFLGRKMPERIGRREALVVVAAAWLACGVFGGLPFVIGARFTPWDAFFEAMSGFTTTGATILPEIEHRLSPPLHLWRMATHWLGGLGIVVLFVALFPALGVGGKHLFRTEAPGPQTEGLAPRIRETASVLWKVYSLLTLAETALLMLAGMDWFQALMHALSTMGTGGYSTNNSSIAGFDSLPVEIVITIFMVLAGSNFSLFYEARKSGLRVFRDNPEFQFYIGLFFAFSLVIAWNIHGTVHEGIGDSLRYASFQVAAIMTTTGFGTDDFEQWPTLSQTLLVVLYFFGGSAGSTAGGMKIIRILIIFKLILAEIRRGYRPALVAPVRVGNHVVAPTVVTETLAYAMVFILTVGVAGIGVALMDPVDLTTAFMSSLACVANVGPGLGLVGPTDNFGFLSAGSKMLLSFAMLLGRLEFFALLALFVPRFWRR
ncbi:MAG: TrkH family potassium uptake protein [Alphaproteobacteria bacterium]|nr:TrkH family potassium uptake protein [Alphaproteobacteria bacterium]